MTSDSVIHDQAYQFFIEEAPELLQEIESGLLSLRQVRDTATIHRIMRAAHSLKGGSASVGLETIKTLAHRLETIFKALYSDTVMIDTALETQLLAAYDCLRLPLVEQLETGRFDPQLALATAEPILSQLEHQCEDAIAATADFIPGSEELGISMAQSIFEVDVAEGLERLASVIADPTHQPVAGELRAQAEVFLGFSELLGLPGFGAIATATLAAVERFPNRALEIAQLALTDFQAGCTDVLTQPNSQGGCPSAALLHLAEPIETDVPKDAIHLLLDDPSHGQANAPMDDWDQALVSEPATDAVASLQDSLDPNQVFSDLGIFDLIAEESRDTEASPEPPSLTPASELTSGAESDPPEIAPIASEPIAPESAATGLVNAAVTDAQSRETLPVHPLSADALERGESMAAVEHPLPAHQATTDPSVLIEDGAAPLEAPPAITQDLATGAAPTAPVKAAGAASLTVRVEAERLNQMNNLLGELAISRNGLELQNTQLRAAIKDLLGRFSRFQSIAETLRGLSDQMLVAPERHSMHAGTSSVGNSAVPWTNPLAAGNGNRLAVPELSRETEFDSLEMDSYSQLYAQTQTLLEETVQLEESVEDLSLYAYQSEQSLGRHRKMLSQMQDELMWARMIPLEQVLNRFPRVLRDLSNRYGKTVDLQLSGTDILVDKAVLSKLYDPLVQLLRNSFDHGIESANIRQQQGKPAIGQITIEARYQGRQVVIEVQDDGQGLDYGRIRDRAVAQGLLTPEAATTCSQAQLAQLIFHPGFSTAQQVSELSGRGMGLDIVQDQLKGLNGSISVNSLPGQGTVFSLTLPLTLSVINLLICFVGPTPLAIRSDSIEEILVPTPGQLRQTGTQQQLAWREEAIPVYSLSKLLKYNCFIPERPPSQVLATVPTPTNWEAPLLILRQRGQAFAFQVDRLVSEQEMVVKPLSATIKSPIFTYGCTVLGDGSLVPVIDGPVFVENLLQQGLTTQPQAAEVSEADVLTAIAAHNATTGSDASPIQMLEATTVLVVDDAVTLRRTLALSLERAGYRVLQARDGQEALEHLERSQSIEMIICDVEMPNMNGFEFLTKRRETPRFAQIPTMMLTSRGNEKHRWLAMKLGAVGYLTKPYLEQELLSAIQAHIAAEAAQ